MRLYCIGEIPTITWQMCSDLETARKLMGSEARAANDDDCRHVYMTERLWEWSPERIRAELGCSRQTVHGWRKRGGPDLPTRTLIREANRNNRVREVIASKAITSALEVSTVAEANYKKVQDFGQREGVTFDKWKRRPTDEQLIELQKGRTWWELAEVTGLKLATLRAYVYKNPELATAMKAVRKRSALGTNRHAVLPVEEIRKLRDAGMSVHHISEQLKIEQMSIRYWFRKWAKEAANDQADDRRATDNVVGGSDGGAGSEA